MAPSKGDELRGELSPDLPATARTLDQDRTAQLIADYQAGSTVYELADEFGIDRHTVSAILHRHDVPMRRRASPTARPPTPSTSTNRAGPLARIGDRMDVTANAVRKRLLERGVTMRDT